MIRTFTLALLSILAFGACTQRLVCPAYQSAFIYDKEELRKKFSYFQADSTPKVYTASKNKYLVAEEVSYKKKLASLATVEMKDVNPSVPDSLTLDGDVSLAELDMAARSVIDSTYIVDVPRDADSLATEEDSVYVITKDKELRYLRYNKDSIQYRVDQIRLNVDQDNYMWYLRDWLVLPDVRLAQLQGGAREEAAKKKKKGLKGFFSNLFKKKKKVEQDTTQSVAPPVEKTEFDFDYDDLNEQQPEEQVEEPVKKKGLPFLKKKDKTADGEGKPPKKKKEKKPKKEKAVPAEEPAKAEEEDKDKDDGF